MRVNILILSCMALLPIGASGQSAAAAEPGQDFEIVIDIEAMTTASGETRSPDYTAAWLMYATARGGAYEDLQKRNAARRGDDDYVVEVRARSALAAFWNDGHQKKEKAPADVYLAKLVDIDKAGFMEEYVIGTFAKPGWTVPADEFPKIDLAAFWKWAADHLGEIDSPTYAHLKYHGTPPDTAVPGADLPDPDQYSLARMACTDSLDTLGKAVAKWDAEAAKLGGTALAAENLADFNRVLAQTMQSEPYRTTGVTWVSTRPALLTFLAGFCAVDVHRYPLAEGFLTKAVGLAPSHVGARLELSQALIAQQKLDQADAVIEPILTSSQDKCDLGRAWRKRGYIRFDQGRLDESRDAYKRSLEYDPHSDVAISELNLLETEIVKHGGKADPYQPPQAGPQLLTQCSES